MNMELPRRLGKYELQKRLGRGGMAEVWKALDTQLQRYVAIKLLHPTLQADASFVSRFQREAQIIAALHHPNIVQIHDLQAEQISPESSPIFYMVMAYIEGQTLADYIASTSAQGNIPSPLEIVHLFASISMAVDYAHQKGMIHRDIKPANILLDQHNRSRNSMGEPILSDFGLAKLLSITGATQTGTHLGTPLYTSPEQVRGEPGNERSDLYSLGVILYELVTGVSPFQADTIAAVLAHHLFSMPPEPSLLNPQIPVELTRVIMQALEKDPNARAPRAMAMTVALADALHVPLPEYFVQPLSLQNTYTMSVHMDARQYEEAATPNLTATRGVFVAPATPVVFNSGDISVPEESDRAAQGSLAHGSSHPPAAYSRELIMRASLPSSLGGTHPLAGSGALTAGGSLSQERVPMRSSRISKPDALPASMGTLSRFSSGVGNTHGAFSPLVSPRPKLSSPERKRGRWRGLSLVLAVVALLALLSAGWGLYLGFAHHSAPAVTAGGQVFFVSSEQFDPKSAQGIADKLQFSLYHFPPPQPGQGYYAWLLADRHPHVETVPLEPEPQFTLPLKIGPLPFNNGRINYLYPGTTAHDNLLSRASRLLITEEGISGQQLGPKADRSAWRYYAEIPQTAYGTPALSALDHIRHLFYKETKVSVLGLPGGLDVWLFRNTEKVMTEAISARDDYSATNINVGLIRGLFRNMLLNLDGSPNISLDVPGGVSNPDPATRVALLSVAQEQQQKTDLDNNPPGYVDHVALHLNGVVQAPDATPAMRALSTQIIAALNNAKAWLQQVRIYAKQLVIMDVVQLEQPPTLILLDTMLQYATYAYVGQLNPKTNQTIPAVLQAHYDIQKLAALTITGNLPEDL